MYIVLAIIAFGILIAVHEFGHFAVAKLCGVKVNEFAIGMGPAIFKRTKGDTTYSLRCLPIGGFCAMEGEDEETEDPRAFTRQSLWKKILILCAGSFMNFLLGLIVVLIIFSNSAAFGSSTVESTVEDFKYGGESGIQPGDRIVSINGSRIFYSGDFSTYMSRTADTSDIVIERDGEKITLKDYPLKQEYYDVDGETVYRYGISFKVIKATFTEKIRYSFCCAYNFVRYVWMGLSDLITGAVGLKELSGVVGIVSTINEVAETSETTSAALYNVAYLCAFIAVNLAVMNMLPIPALDGGRIFLLLVTWCVERIIRRKIDPKYEGYIHAIGLILLLALMAYVMFNDIVKIIR